MIVLATKEPSNTKSHSAVSSSPPPRKSSLKKITASNGGGTNNAKNCRGSARRTPYSSQPPATGMPAASASSWQCSTSTTFKEKGPFTAPSTSSNTSAVRPYCFRDEPEKKKVVKTELCKAILDGRHCKFGDKCNYAHHKGELRYTKLLERHEVGLINKDTYMTRPCFTHVSTGSCPFKLRCQCIHDPRITGPSNSYWLQHCAFNSSQMPTDVHIDWFDKSDFSTIHAGHPFGNHVNTQQKGKILSPTATQPSQSQPLAPGLLSSYKTLYDNICNQTAQRRITRNINNDDHRSRRICMLTQAQRVAIALKMGPEKYSDLARYKYQLSHEIYSTPCMLIQTRVFDVRSVGAGSCLEEIPVDSFNPFAPSHIIVREIAFGPPSSPTDPPVMLWFNILDKDVRKLEPKEVMRHKRTDRKLRAKRANKVQDYNPKMSSDARVAGLSRHTKNSFRYSPSKFSDDDCLVEAPFIVSAPRDKVCFDFVHEMLRHNLKAATASENQTKTKEHDEEYLLLAKKFDAIKRHLSLFHWPINRGRETVDRNTPMPKVNAFYSLPSSHQNKHQGKLWSSFLQNAREEDFGGLSSTSNKKAKQEEEKDNGVLPLEEECEKTLRLEVFLKLSKGQSASNLHEDGQIPYIKKKDICHHTARKEGNTNNHDEDYLAWKSILLAEDSSHRGGGWDFVKEYYNLSKRKELNM